MLEISHDHWQFKQKDYDIVSVEVSLCWGNITAGATTMTVKGRANMNSQACYSKSAAITLFIMAALGVIGCEAPDRTSSIDNADSSKTVNFKNEIESANNKIAALVKAVEQVDSEKVQLKNEIEQAKSKIAALVKAVEQVDSEKVQLKNEIEQAKSKIADLTNSINKMSAENVSIMKEVGSANSQIAELTTRIDVFVKLYVSSMLDNPGTSAILTPGSGGYSKLRYDLGVVTVSIKDIAQYANGTKVTLQFGNTLSATINGLSAKIQYGPVNESGVAQYDVAKTKEVTFNESFDSGSWADVDVVLEGIPSSQLGFVSISELTNRGISLKQP